MKTKLFTAFICLIMGMSLPSLHAADKAAPKETTVVIAEGVGINADKALLKALRNAVQQVVGVIVDAETLIKNEKVVKDEILDFSNGFVEKFEKIKEGKNDDGLYEVTVKATVKRRQLIEKLKQTKVYSAKVDGESLFGSVLSEMEAKKKGATLLSKALSDLNLPLSLPKVEVINPKPKIIKVGDKNITAVWSFRVGYDTEKYRKQVYPKLKQVLDDSALFSRKDTLHHDPLHHDPDKRARPSAEEKMGVWRVWFDTPSTWKKCLLVEQPIPTAKLNTIKPQDHNFVYLFKHWTKLNGHEHFHFYCVDDKVAKILEQASHVEPILRIELKDKNGDAIHKEDLKSLKRQNLSPMQHSHPHASYQAAPMSLINSIQPYPSGSPRSRSCYNIQPLVFHKAAGGKYVYGESYSFDWTIELPIQSLNKITKIECSFVEANKK